MVELPEGKMKSREGTVVDADDLMAEMISTAREISQELGKLDEMTPEEAENIARIVGLGSLKYFILKGRPSQEYDVQPERVYRLQRKIRDHSSNIPTPVSVPYCAKQRNRASHYRSSYRLLSPFPRKKRT